MFHNKRYRQTTNKRIESARRAPPTNVEPRTVSGHQNYQIPSQPHPHTHTYDELSGTQQPATDDGSYLESVQGITSSNQALNGAYNALDPVRVLPGPYDQLQNRPPYASTGPQERVYLELQG